MATLGLEHPMVSVSSLTTASMLAMARPASDRPLSVCARAHRASPLMKSATKPVARPHLKSISRAPMRLPFPLLQAPPPLHSTKLETSTACSTSAVLSLETVISRQSKLAKAASKATTTCLRLSRRLSCVDADSATTCTTN